MKHTRPSLDGMIPRQSSSGASRHAVGGSLAGGNRPSLHSGADAPAASSIAQRPTETTLGAPSRQSLSETLQTLDDDRRLTRRERKQLKRQAEAPSRKKRRRIVKLIVWLIVIAIVAVGAYVVVRAVIAGGNIFQGNLLGLTQRQPLKEDANGRSNFLIFGTAEDDEGGEHGGANLTDSIMVLSVNQTTKDAFMISLPRDLWVRYETSCSVGYEGKINAVYFCASDDGTNEAAGAAALQKTAGDILGLEIQYYVHLNFTAVVQSVDAVGGVDVTIESEDPRGILDRNFDWKCGYRCHYVKYENGEHVHLDGEHALALARARNASGGYGLPNGNFDREKNQQKIIKSLREKALSVGTLTNIGKVTGLMEALGNNLRTNIDTSEIQTLMSLASDIESDAITSLTLNDKDDPLVDTDSYANQSIVRPLAGLRDYSDIIAYVAKHTSSNPVVREAAPIVVLNGTGQSGVALRESETLEEKGYTISLVDNAPDGQYATVEIYRLKTTGTSATASALMKHYGVTTLSEGEPPLAVSEDTAFVVVIGAVRDQQ